MSTDLRDRLEWATQTVATLLDACGSTPPGEDWEPSAEITRGELQSLQELLSGLAAPSTGEQEPASDALLPGWWATLGGLRCKATGAETTALQAVFAHCGRLSVEVERLRGIRYSVYFCGRLWWADLSPVDAPCADGPSIVPVTGE